MKNYKNYCTTKCVFFILSLAAHLTLFSCEEQIQPDLEEGPKRLVIEARLVKAHDIDSTLNSSIRLTTTNAYFEQGPPPAAQGALVRIINEQMDTFWFEESAPGLYQSERLTLNDQSDLSLIIDYDGMRYQARDHIRKAPPLDTVFVRREKTEFDQDSVWAVYGGLTDPGEQENYYLWEIEHLDRDSLIFFNPGEDRYWNGGRVEASRINFFFAPADGATIRVYQHAISKEAFEYYTYLFRLITQRPGPFDTPPAPAKGNISNISNPELYPLGYFRVSEADFRDLLVK